MRYSDEQIGPLMPLAAQYGDAFSASNRTDMASAKALVHRQGTQLGVGEVAIETLLAATRDSRTIYAEVEDVW